MFGFESRCKLLNGEILIQSEFGQLSLTPWKGPEVLWFHHETSIAFLGNNNVGT